MLSIEKTALILIDVQGKLAQLVHRKETLFENLQKLVRGAQVLELPIFWNEQLPEKLGPTIPELVALLPPPQRPLAKATFSCCGNPQFLEALQKTGRTQLLLAGIEAHVCVYQTCIDLVRLNYEVHVVADAVSSRMAQNCEIALSAMKSSGAALTSVEMALFELLRVADGPRFKQVIQIVK